MKKEFYLSAGNYVVGDPCYSVKSNENWKELLGEDNFKEGIGKLEGEFVYAFNTSFGDGIYYDDFDVEYGVDSGLIGIMPFSLVRKVASEERIKEILENRRNFLGRLIEFKDNFKVIFDDENDPTHTFGNICIDTITSDYTYEREYEDDYEDDEEDNS